MVVPKEVHELKPLLGIGTSIAVTGVVKELEGLKQAIELTAIEIKYVGECDNSKYPLYAGALRLPSDSLCRGQLCVCVRARRSCERNAGTRAAIS